MSRRDREQLGYAVSPILDARELKLSVLAPGMYYLRYFLALLAKALHTGLVALGERHDASMGFSFTAFPSSFPQLDNGFAPPNEAHLIAILDAREEVV